MSLFGSVVASIVVFISFAVFRVPPNEAKECDQARLQGTWKIVAVECGGKKDDRDIDKYTIKFEGSTLIVRECDGNDADEATVKFRLCKGRGSRHITFGGICGIYDFKDENLRICYSLNGDEPVELKTTAVRPEEVLLTLKRLGQPLQRR
jgi:uncharacterized protein (TIGR03067 family)